jgi:hypothetical protein
MSEPPVVSTPGRPQTSKYLQALAAEDMLTIRSSESPTE